LESQAVHLQQHFKGKEHDEEDIGHICREADGRKSQEQSNAISI
jgi:hypothetical protein